MGTLPTGLAGLTRLQYVAVPYYAHRFIPLTFKFSHSLPFAASLSGHGCTCLDSRYLDLSGTYITGSVPTTYSALTGLTYAGFGISCARSPCMLSNFCGLPDCFQDPSTAWQRHQRHCAIVPNGADWLS